MSLADNLGRYRSVAVVGMAKNVGKTETLNYVIREALNSGLRIGVTSIGLDGETIDSVTATSKPEITIGREMLFATSETHYRARRLESEILGIDDRNTALGRVVTARALSRGKVLLSGPAETAGVKRLIESMRNEGAGTILVDGALSRLSPASPAITDAMILATGAALSPDIATIVRKTAFVCRLIDLPQEESGMSARLEEIEKGVWTIGENGEITDTGASSGLELEKLKKGGVEKAETVYVAGMVGDKLMRLLAKGALKHPMKLIVRDFTRLFVERATLAAFLKTGAAISVLKRSKLICVTINPWSPAGYTVDGKKLQQELQARLDVPVLNVREKSDDI